MTDALLDVLRRAPDVFDFGNELVSIGRSGTICPMNEHGLRYAAGGLTQFWRWQKLPYGGTVEVLIDPPPNICKNVLALGGQRELKPLDAVITAPTLRPNGSVLSSPGYDVSTRLLFDAENLPPDIPEFPDPEQRLAALEYLWKPFADFPFVGSLDRAVHSGSTSDGSGAGGTANITGVWLWRPRSRFRKDVVGPLRGGSGYW